MAVRSEESERIGRLQTAHAARLVLAERILDFSAAFLKDRLKGTVDEEGRILVTRVLVAFYQKIVADLWAIAVLSERGLPTASLTRDLLENVISVAYIASDNSVERARLCRNYLYEFNRRELATRMWCGDTSIPDHEEQKLDLVLLPRIESVAIMFGMQQWKETWAGRAVEELANEAALPEPLRRNMLAFLYARSAHALDSDWKSLVRSLDNKAVETDVPARVEWHILLACDATVTALEIIGGHLGVDRQAELVVLHAEIERIWRNPFPELSIERQVEIDNVRYVAKVFRRLDFDGFTLALLRNRLDYASRQTLESHCWTLDANWHPFPVDGEFQVIQIPFPRWPDWALELTEHVREHEAKDILTQAIDEAVRQNKSA